MLRATLALSLLTMTATSGCGDNGGGTEPVDTGFVSIDIEGLSVGIVSAGTATITGPDIDTTLTLPPIAAAVLPVPVGTYDVVYLPPSGHTIAPGTPNELQVTVTKNDTTDVGFQVVLASGALNINVTGIQAGAANGGSASVLRTDIGGQTPLIVNVPASGSVTASLIPGSYNVVYTPPAEHVVEPGTPGELNAVVSAGGTAVMGFEVIPATATLRIAVTGLLAGATSGGSASVLRTDIAGQTPIPANIPATGTLDLSVAPGTYSVNYTVPAGHQLVAGQTNPRSIVVPVATTQTTTYAVEAVVVTGGLLFRSDFSTALGTSQAALLDTGQLLPWNQIIGNGALNEVITSTGLDFPTPNVLRVTAEFRAGVGGAAQTIRRQGGIAIPAVGQSLFYRWYARVVVPNTWTNDPLTHPMQDALSNTNWEWEVLTNTDGTWMPTWNLAGGGGNAFPNNRWRPAAPLNKGQTYRFEFQIHRIGTTTYNLHVRVYNSTSTTPILTDAQIQNAQGSGTLASNPTLNFADVNELAGIQSGFNGLTGGTAADYPMILYYQAGFCIRSNDWCGPYSAGN